MLLPSPLLLLTERDVRDVDLGWDLGWDLGFLGADRKRHCSGLEVPWRKDLSRGGKSCPIMGRL